jgi:hypothetical protein
MALRKAPHPERDPEPSAKGSSRRTQGRRSNSPADNFTRSQDEVAFSMSSKIFLILRVCEFIDILADRVVIRWR